MKTVKVSELTGASLDWVVAKCENRKFELVESFLDYYNEGCMCYSTNWSQGGPIIERIKGFQFKHWLESKLESCCEARIHNYDGDWVQFGLTPLIAAMRCYVSSKLGDEVEIPKELM